MSERIPSSDHREAASPTWPQTLWSAVQYLLPHHLISRGAFHLTRWRTPFTASAIRWFVRRFDVDLSEAAVSDPTAYATFNAFFTRALKPEARPIAPDPDDWISPCDGRISQIGAIQSGNLLQAKSRDYSVLELLGGDTDLAQEFAQGTFATIYLSPRDYHRVHMPCQGRLRTMIHVPGRLFSVSPATVQQVPNLFARNERVVCVFDTDQGAMALVLVGAINVAAIETVWSGLVTPPSAHEVTRRDYGENTGVTVELMRGQEMGRFNMGSTVIVLAPPDVDFSPDWQPQMPIRLGQSFRHVGDVTSI